MKRLATLFLAALFAFAPVAQADLRASSGAFGPVVITSGTGVFSAGTASTPSVAVGDTGSGIYQATSNVLGFSVANGGRIALGAGSFQAISGLSYGWTSSTTDPIAGTFDTSFARSGPGIVQLNGATNAATEFRVSAGNGGFISNVKTVSESLPIAAAATTVGATTIPAGAILLAVSVRVTTVIPTAATFTITTTVGGTTLNTAAVNVAAGSTDPGTAAGASFRSAATTVTITPSLSPATATGVVRLQYYYLQVTPPTS